MTPQKIDLGCIQLNLYKGDSQKIIILGFIKLDLYKSDSTRLPCGEYRVESRTVFRGTGIHGCHDCNVRRY